MKKIKSYNPIKNLGAFAHVKGAKAPKVTGAKNTAHKNPFKSKGK